MSDESSMTNLSYTGPAIDPKPAPTVDKLIETFIQISSAHVDLFKKKQNDYGPGNIARFGEYGVVVRISDKIERLINLMQTGKEIQNESLEDTWRDIAIYAIIGLICHRGEWPRG